jgi:hypothetical protein
MEPRRGVRLPTSLEQGCGSKNRRAGARRASHSDYLDWRSMSARHPFVYKRRGGLQGPTGRERESHTPERNRPREREGVRHGGKKEGWAPPSCWQAAPFILPTSSPALSCSASSACAATDCFSWPSAGCCAGAGNPAFLLSWEPDGGWQRRPSPHGALASRRSRLLR